MKKQFFDFMRTKAPSVKEINLSFSQSQDKNTSSQRTNDESNINQNNQSLAQIEISFWKKNILQMQDQYDSLKSFDSFKEKQLYLLKCELNDNNSNETIENEKKQNTKKLKDINDKFKEEESKLKDELS